MEEGERVLVEDGRERMMTLTLTSGSHILGLRQHIVIMSCLCMEQVKTRLNQCWCPGEVLVYIDDINVLTQLYN